MHNSDDWKLQYKFEWKPVAVRATIKCTNCCGEGPCHVCNQTRIISEVTFPNVASRPEIHPEFLQYIDDAIEIFNNMDNEEIQDLQQTNRNIRNEKVIADLQTKINDAGYAYSKVLQDLEAQMSALMGSQ